MASLLTLLSVLDTLCVLRLHVCSLSTCVTECMNYIEIRNVLLMCVCVAFMLFDVSYLSPGFRYFLLLVLKVKLLFITFLHFCLVVKDEDLMLQA